jgi:hypothetical protein
MSNVRSSLDKKPEVVLDAVYQVQRPDGTFQKKYVKTIRTYGDDSGKIETEIVLDRDQPKREGAVNAYDADLLGTPDTYPRFMFQPEIWEAKAKQSLDEIKVEANAIIDDFFQLNPAVAAFDVNQDADKVVDAIKRLLSGYFGPFMLGLILHWIKGKIENRIEQSGGVIRPMPFERKLGSIKRDLQERQANLALPESQRGQFNAQHPFGTPRPVQEFGQKVL